MTIENTVASTVTQCVGSWTAIATLSRGERRWLDEKDVARVGLWVATFGLLLTSCLAIAIAGAGLSADALFAGALCAIALVIAFSLWVRQSSKLAEHLPRV